MTQQSSARTGRRASRGRILLIALAAVAALAAAGYAIAGDLGRELTGLEQANLANFDDLDFNVFTGQKWDELGRSHSRDVIVHWPDGRTTLGIDVHIEDLKGMFVFAPDTRIQEHPIRIASGRWTAVTGIMEGTFSEPMPIGDGQTIPPTGKTFKLSMATIGRWEDGTMAEEWLFWDNQAFMKQIGLVE